LFSSGRASSATIYTTNGCPDSAAHNPAFFFTFIVSYKTTYDTAIVSTFAAAY
jgi:hypothetical protein